MQLSMGVWAGVRGSCPIKQASDSAVDMSPLSIMLRELKNVGGRWMLCCGPVTVGVFELLW